jgi:hypothetical protein
MIAANDLRIGNWVLFNKTSFDYPSDLHPITGISKYGIYTIYRSPISFDKIHPISLSPEILDKCGFEKETPDNKYGEVYKKEGFNFIIRKVDFGIYPKSTFGYAFELSDDKNWATIKSKIEHLHQLQNLYYCLVGQELQINL